MSALLPVASLLAGYLLGSVSFAVLVAKARGVDIFQAGSGNPGATNVKRVLGRKAGNLVFMLDFLKGAVATGWPLLAPVETTAPVAAICGLLGAILGHSFSCFLKFRGGKGVATTMGGLLALMPIVLFVGLGVWVLVFFTSRYVSLASIAFGVSLPLSAWLTGLGPVMLGFSLALALLIVVRHRSNIRRLLNGTESRFQPRGKEPPAAPEA
ncbi:MAG: glycerol-3-phosphate 1-O-acyltransferase PlsY [Opitutales bacterium]